MYRVVLFGDFFKKEFLMLPCNKRPRRGGVGIGSLGLDVYTLKMKFTFALLTFECPQSSAQVTVGHWG